MFDFSNYLNPESILKGLIFLLGLALLLTTFLSVLKWQGLVVSGTSKKWRGILSAVITLVVAALTITGNEAAIPALEDWGVNAGQTMATAIMLLVPVVAHLVGLLGLSDKMYTVLGNLGIVSYSHSNRFALRLSPPRQQPKAAPPVRGKG